MIAIEITPELISKKGNDWHLNVPMAHSGRAMFAVIADWCHYCKELKKNVTEAQQTARFPFFHMDGDKNGTFAQTMGVRGYPTIFHVGRDGLLTRYNGGRDKDSLIQMVYSK